MAKRKTEKKYIAIRVSSKMPVGELLKWVNKKGLTGWELFARYVNPPNHGGWHAYHFRKALKSKHLKP